MMVEGIKDKRERREIINDHKKRLMKELIKKKQVVPDFKKFERQIDDYLLELLKLLENR